ncbi:MAG TPA: hypothetical protein VFH01_12855 [Pyrinomonadaceae bacterium]|nr:hypothetical protein [Pyrinomonadaceae bacterium]
MDSRLISYWVVPQEEHCGVPFGIGVTAYSVADAFALIRECNWPMDLSAVKVTENVKFDDLDQQHVVPNMGPMTFRGVWYPCLNIGWGASGQEDDA